MSANFDRWTWRRKAAILAEIANGRLSIAEACLLYTVAAEELAEWQRRYAADGPKGLRVSGERLKGARKRYGEA